MTGLARAPLGRECLAAWLTAALLALSGGAVAQVKMEDALKRDAPARSKKPAKAGTSTPAAEPTPAETPTPPLACKSQPGGCNAKFRPVAESLLPQWFADQEKTPEEARATKARAITYLKRYHETLLKGGGEVNDVGRAYAYFVAVLYMAYASNREGPDREQFRMLVQRCQEELAEDPKFQENSDREKQFVYERMILVAMNNEDALAYARDKKDRSLEERHRQRAKDWLEDVTKRKIDKIPTMWK